MNSMKSEDLKSETPAAVGSGALLGCPWCGSRAELVSFDDGTCFARCTNSHCAVSPETGIFRDKEFATTAWNQRKQPNAEAQTRP